MDFNLVWQNRYKTKQYRRIWVKIFFLAAYHNQPCLSTEVCSLVYMYYDDDLFYLQFTYKVLLKAISSDTGMYYNY